MKIKLYIIFNLVLIGSCGLPRESVVSYDVDQVLPNESTVLNKKLTAGHLHTCVITNEATVRCWGSNSNGQIGDGSTSDRLTPTEVGNLRNVVEITAGFAHTCALIADGTVKCWGSGGDGQLGNGSISDNFYPITVVNLSGATSISAGYNHTCALILDGTVKCWGNNTYKQLTTYKTGQVILPEDVPAIGSINSVSTGHNHTCWITSGNTIECWGMNTYGQIGYGSISVDVGTPTAIFDSSTYIQVSPANNHTCGLLYTGSIRCWGKGDYGELGDGMNISYQIPVDVSGITSAKKISTGEEHSCAILHSGELYCWGGNSRGQVSGDGDVTMKASPVQVPIGTLVNDIATGNQHTCVITNTNIVKCWGSNSNGQIGDGTIIDRNYPVTVLSL